ncbi:MAG: hypothetical protein H0V80_06815 [Acidobacteria bacterium]|nr:hypothetical protein [Acidobacteriota bacterium]
MRPSVRAWVVCGLLFGALVAWQVDRWLFTPHGLASTWEARDASGILSAASPAGLTQTFTIGADGFDGIWLRPVLDGTTAVHGDLVVDLHAVAGERRVRLTRLVLPAGEAARPASLHVPLPQIHHSRGRTYQLGLRHVRRGQGPALGFRATRDDVLPTGRCFADGVEQWGDLVLRTSSRRATLPYWLHEVLRPWPAWLRAWPTVLVLVLAFNLLLAWTCASASGVLPQRSAALPAVRAAPVPACGPRGVVVTPPVLRLARPFLLVAISTCLLVALWPTPVRRTLDLIDHLPDARITTTWRSLHEGVSRERVVFFGPLRRVIVAMPSTRLAWTVEVPRGSVLQFGAAMRPDMWNRESDGITMDVVIEHRGARLPVAHFTLVPMLIETHKNEHPGYVPLDRWAGQQITVVFETTPERWGNAVNDVPVWVEPRIEWPRAASSGEARIVR